jgi:ceramide glucosyltransferase
MPLMPHDLAWAVELATTVMTLAGMGYMLATMIAARVHLHGGRRQATGFAPGVSILKSLKGLDPGMMDAFRSHCRQEYAGEYELLFGVSSADDPAATAVEELRREFPGVAIRLIVCPERLGANGKVSTLAQMAGQARHEYLLINDSDITVSPRYLARVMGCFAPVSDVSGAKARTHPRKPVGLVTTLYRGRAHGSLASRFEALGIATDFMPGVLLSKLVEGGLHFGLGATLAVSREALEKAGGLLSVVDHLADDYELGARVDGAGYKVVLSAEVVETAVPAYAWRAFFDHQLRWMRTVRAARPAGYTGLVFAHGLCWALLNLVASGLSPVSLWLLALSFFLRLAQAMTVGAEVLGDRQVLATLWLLPVRDLVAMGVWAAGFAGDTIVWRGERFVLEEGRLRASKSASQQVSKSAG